MATFLGLVELIVWIVSVVGIAAGITYGVIKFFPSREDKKPEDASSTPAES